MTDNAQYIQEIEKLKNSWDYTTAREKVQKYLTAYTDDYRLYEELADIYLFEGEIEKAEHAMRFAQNLNPESATWLYLSGYIYISKWSFKRWVELLEKANELFPNNPEILRNLGWWYNMTRQVKKWITILKRALNLASEDQLIMEDLGVALMWDWQTDLWEFYLRKAGREDKIKEMRNYL
ncbi:MAG: hypothetical protein ACD_2C00256G0007 [uncultured bacterium (gcode 4)]|uniref:Uncharacterized protein n=1 Tax=uncultured bacterium (gcode 4) TaxID=1234023 RepID=K2GZN1_9BACT|nr:MAG: hypothetical protein ACD_2C00256G0007 [uncultured bacterium (gcode 4)]